MLGTEYSSVVMKQKEKAETPLSLKILFHAANVRGILVGSVAQYAVHVSVVLTGSTNARMAVLKT